jgi:hypothetical protein
MTHKTINIADHPNNNDATGKLVWEDKANHRHVYSVRGGFVACPDFCLAFDGLFPTEKAARIALEVAQP